MGLNFTGDGVGDVFIRDYIRKTHLRGALRDGGVVDEKGEFAQPAVLGVGDCEHCAQGFGAERGCGAEGSVFGEACEVSVVRGGGLAAVFSHWKDAGAAAGEFGAEGRGRRGGVGGNSTEDRDIFSGDILENGEGEQFPGVPGGRGGEGKGGRQRVGGGLSDGERGEGRLRGRLAGCGFGGNKDRQVDVVGAGGLGGEFLNDNGGAEDGLESAFFQLRRERAGAVERAGEPNGGGGGWRHCLPGSRLIEDIFGGGYSALFGFGLRGLGFGAEDGAIVVGEKGADVDFVVFHNCMGAERGVAVAADFCAKSAFGEGADADVGVVDCGGEGGVLGGSALHREDSLSDGGNKKVCGEDLGDMLLHTHSAESGGSQNEGVALSGLHFCEAGLQISPNGGDFEARKMAGYERGTAGAGSANNGAVGELLQGEVLAGHDGVAGVFGKSDGGEDERGRGGGGHVFEGVDGEMGAVCEEFGL